MSFEDNGLVVTPISPSFGIEVAGVDFSKPVPSDTIATLIKLQDRFGYTVFRSTGLDNDRHVAFAAQLGNKLEQNPMWHGQQRLGTPYLFDVGNIEPDGTLVKKGSRRWHHALGNALWHTDSSYSAPRAKYSLLCCHNQPTAGVANTGFADTRKAYNDLPEATKQMLEGLIVEHDLWHSRKLASPVFYKEPTPEEKRSKPPSFHRLVQTAPNGDKTLYLAAHAKRVVGLSQEDSDKLIGDLMAHCTKPEYTLEMQWLNAGDLLWWDNRQSMHRATLFDTELYRRDVRRATVVDDGPYATGVTQEEVIAANRPSISFKLVQTDRAQQQTEPALVYATSPL